MRYLYLLPLVFTFPLFGAFPDICERCWYEVPHSNLDAVAQTPKPPGSSYFRETMGYNGGAFDTRRNRLLVSLGGYTSYAGNEIYAFDVDSLKWFRIKNGSTFYDKDDTLYAYYKNGGTVPDSQQPRPGYTFDQIEYDSASDNLHVFGVPFAYKNGTTWTNIHRLNLSTLRWSRGGDIGHDIYGGSVSAQDPATGKIWFLGNGATSWMSSYSPGTGVRTDHGDAWFGDGIASYQTGAILPPKNRFISIGGGAANFWNLVTSGNTDRQTLVTFGCDSLKAVHGPGFEWSPVENKMVGWAGGTSVYTMDTSFTCSEVPASGSNIVTPENPSRYGTFGRWRYIPKYNVFMVVNSTNGNVYFYRHSAYNPSAATVEITSPADNFLTNQGSVPVTWTVNGINQTSGTTETLGREGANLIKRCHVNVCDSVTVIRDQTPPAVVITQPASSHVTTDATIWVRWTLDGIPKSFYYSLVPGTNLIVVDFTDAAGNRGADTVTVTRGSPSIGRPVFPAGANLIAANIRSTSMTLNWTAASASGGLKEYVLYKDKAPMATIRAPSTTYTAVGLLRGKDHEFRVEAVDSSQRMSINGPLRIFRTDDRLPPEPSTVASPIPHGQPTLLANAVAFLHEGPNSIQSGVTDSLMDPVRSVVVRGAVRTRSGAMLPGVTVSVLGHSEVGSTLSRQNGEFDLVVNGGGSLVLVYAAEGYLESQRTVHPRWQEYMVLDTVTLVTRDTVVNTVDLSAGTPMQAIQSGVVTDESGTRRATLIVPAGTKANLLLPDGTRQPLGSMRVRMTEYTVGASGPSAMPASLPPSSAYTYALDYTVEEALGVNASGVVFEAPIYGYVENFVGIPVGYAVPSAYHDKAKGVWVPQDDGRVIKIAAIQGGMADLVVDTSGITAGDAYLDSLGITVSERIKLAELHAVNQTLWRVPIRHFSSHYYSFPVGLPGDKKFPKAGKASGDDDPNECDTRSGSIIDCHRQSLGETVRFPGLPSMNYRSHRVASRRWNRLDIAVTGPSVPLSVSRVTLDVTIAGRKYHYVYPRAANLTQVVEWDGLDIYGRPLKGKQPYAYSISYGYSVDYAPPPRLPRAGLTGNLDVTPRTFGMPSGLSFPDLVPARAVHELSDTYTSYLGSIDVDAIAPGWTLENHHVYDPTDGVLHMGDGQDVGARSGLGAIYTVAGSGGRTPVDGQSAKASRLEFINGMDIGPDGSLHVACRQDSTVWRIGRDGRLRKMAQGRPWYDVNVAPDGSLYLTDGEGSRIWKRGPDGTLSVVAGSGISSFEGDGGPATVARLHAPNTAVQGPDGSLYIADRGNHRVRKVTPDGIIQTVAGTGATTFNGDGIPARAANMSVTHLAVAADGNIYVADGANCRIRRIDAGGIVTTVAGNGISGSLGDDGPALEAQITADRIKVVNTKAGGTLIYLADDLNNTIRVIDENGIIHRLAGGGAFELKEGFSGTEANLSEPRGLAVDANGTVYIGRFTSGQTAVRKIQARFPGYDNKTLLIPSPDGGEVFQFSAEGRHLKTFHAFTGAELLAFAYDVSGRLTHITDAHGNVTEIRRGPSGAASALISPYGQSLSLDTDSKGNLTEITLPDASRHAFTYNSLGLIASYSTPREKVYAFTYDSLGRLVEDEDPAGGFQTLSREDTSLGVRTTVRTALGRETRYTLRHLNDLSKEKTTVDPAGLATRTVTFGDGLVSTREPDGAESVVKLGPEPRFAFQDMRAVATTVTLPSSLSRTTRGSGRAVLADSLDPLSLLSYADTTWINARRSISRYVDAQRTWIHLTPEGRRDTTRIDSLGRVVERSVPGLEKTTYTYDSRGRLATQTQGTGVGARTTTYGYDALGRLSTVEDPQGRVHLYAYDLAGRLIRETLPDGREVKYAYDADGNIAFILPPGRPAHVFAYNAVGLDTLYDPPSLGAGTWHTGIGYNLDRQRLTVHRPDGQAVAYRYDAAGRLDSILTPMGPYVFRYQPQTGRLDSLRSPQGIGLAYAHDGGLVTRETWFGEVAGSVSWVHDENFFVRLQILNGTDTLETQFDSDGLPWSVGELALWFDGKNGRLLETYLGDITDHLDYNGFGELEGYHALSGMDTLFQSRYTRDKLGRITRKTETVQGVTKVNEYVHDPAGRLREVVLNGVDTIRYAYDSNGNRLARVHPLGVDSGHYDEQDRLLDYAGRRFTYTANGDLAAHIQGADTTTFEYDVFGNLIAVELPDATKIEYVIDGKNRRVGRKVNGVMRQGFLYQGQQAPVAELDGAGNVIARFIYASRSHVPDYMIKGGITYRILSDHLGSPRLIVDAWTGEVAQRIDYDEFGVVTYNSNPGFQPFGFAGGIVDPSTSMTKFGVRDYNPAPGRWTNKDPLMFRGRSLNLYEYVENDPVNSVDPSGRKAIPVVVPVIPASAAAASAMCGE